VVHAWEKCEVKSHFVKAFELSSENQSQIVNSLDAYL